MKKEKKTDLAKLVKKAKGDNIADGKKGVKDTKPLESDIPDLEEHSVEPVIKSQNKGKKPKGAIRNGTKKPPGKANAGAIKKSEKKPTVGEEAPLSVPDRTGNKRKRGFFDWFVDGGESERNDKQS